ncbi:MAG TPA: hypothetical protein VK778_15560 [Solirubrobacteraceae bacterium]|nr:hypothetical protein [Solirubrobacteraceae bacterium]
MEQTDKKRSFAAGAAETSPLLVGVVGISIPVGLIALACVEESVVALVFAVLAMFAVGATTLGFVLRLASDEPEVEGAE